MPKLVKFVKLEHPGRSKAAVYASVLQGNGTVPPPVPRCCDAAMLRCSSIALLL